MSGILSRLFSRGAAQGPVTALYADAVAQARQPALFGRLAIPDTVEGQFESIALHVFLVLRRLRRDPAARERAQALFDLLFQDMDRSLRELGVSDVVIGDRVKTLARGFYGRVAAYDAALDRPDADPDLTEALARNLYAGAPVAPEVVTALAAYVRASDRRLAEGLPTPPFDWPEFVD